MFYLGRLFCSVCIVEDMVFMLCSCQLLKDKIRENVD